MHLTYHTSTKLGDERMRLFVRLLSHRSPFSIIHDKQVGERERAVGTGAPSWHRRESDISIFAHAKLLLPFFVHFGWDIKENSRKNLTLFLECYEKRSSCHFWCIRQIKYIAWYFFGVKFILLCFWRFYVQNWDLNLPMTVGLPDVAVACVAR